MSDSNWNPDKNKQRTVGSSSGYIKIFKDILSDLRNDSDKSF